MHWESEGGNEHEVEPEWPEPVAGPELLVDLGDPALPLDTGDLGLGVEQLGSLGGRGRSAPPEAVERRVVVRGGAGELLVTGPGPPGPRAQPGARPPDRGGWRWRA